MSSTPRDATKGASAMSSEQNNSGLNEAKSEFDQGKAGTVDENSDASGERSSNAKGHDSIVKNHVIAAMGLGLIPVPIFDAVSIAGVQLNMVRQLADRYDVPFKENAVRGGILALVGGTLPVSLGMSAASLLKSIPGLGSASGAAGVVLLAGASTYAVGEVFNRHLASGGTLLDFDASKARDLFKQKFEEGKEIAKRLRPKAKAEAETSAA